MEKVVLSVDMEFGPDGLKVALKSVRNSMGDDITHPFRNYAIKRGADLSKQADLEATAGDFAKEFGNSRLLP